MKKLFIRDLINKFPFEILSGESKLDSTQIPIYGLNRAGLELTGFVDTYKETKRRPVLMSSKEEKYISQFNKEERIQRYEELMKSGIPLIMITQKFKDKLIIEVAKKLNYPLLRINTPSTIEFTQHFLQFQEIYFAPEKEIHASLVNIYGKGVLITGQSGIGKSEITMDLIRNNHLFVGDDRIVLINKSSNIYGHSHPILKNLVEVRGIGIMDISKTNGYQILLDETQIDLIIELFNFGANGHDDSDRLGREYTTKNILGIDIPFIRIPVSSGRSIANLIESAVAQLKLKQSGDYEDVISVMNERMDKK